MQWHGSSQGFEHVQVVCGTMGLPTATVRMRGPDGIARTSTGMGSGPVDAAYKAIDSLVRVQVQTPVPCPHTVVAQSMPAGFCCKAHVSACESTPYHCLTMCIPTVPALQWHAPMGFTITIWGQLSSSGELLVGQGSCSPMYLI